MSGPWTANPNAACRTHLLSNGWRGGRPRTIDRSGAPRSRRANTLISALEQAQLRGLRSFAETVAHRLALATHAQFCHRLTLALWPRRCELFGLTRAPLHGYESTSGTSYAFVCLVFIASRNSGRCLAIGRRQEQDQRHSLRQDFFKSITALMQASEERNALAWQQRGTCSKLMRVPKSLRAKVKLDSRRLTLMVLVSSIIT